MASSTSLFSVDNEARVNSPVYVLSAELAYSCTVVCRSVSLSVVLTMVLLATLVALNVLHAETVPDWTLASAVLASVASLIRHCVTLWV
eukprot:21927-Eustigmatos_ZCMA.PRE.1